MNIHFKKCRKCRKIFDFSKCPFCREEKIKEKNRGENAI